MNEDTTAMNMDTTAMIAPLAPTLPSVTVMCLTYGRTRLLEESLQSFLQQDYAGAKSMIVLNDLPEQRLTLADHPSITVVNWPERFGSLGDKRNMAAKLAGSDLVMTWSDDDIHLPWRIREFVAVYEEGAYVTDASHFFFSPPAPMRFVRRPCGGPFLMARQDYWKCGAIPALSLGEDISFRSRALKQCRLRTVSEPSFIYRWQWAAGSFHISGYRANGWEKAGAHVKHRLCTGKEPCGEVRLSPQWRADYVRLAMDALEHELAPAHA